MHKSEAGRASIRVITPSFRGDVERCAALCASFDIFAGPEFHHQVIVPRRDLPRFRGLAGPRREILCVQDVVPAHMLHLPGRREHWLIGLGVRRRGWLVQQLVKVAAARAGGVDAVVFADSDIAFVRPLTAAHVLKDGRVGLFQSTSAAHYAIDPNYAKWYRGAARLLGVALPDPYPTTYVAPLASWVPALATAMCERIEAATGRSWISAASGLAGETGFSEYTTYGVFVERAEPAAAARHVDLPARLCHVSWDYDIATSAGREAFVDALAPEHVAVLIQSNLRLPTRDWRALLETFAKRQPGRASASETP